MMTRYRNFVRTKRRYRFVTLMQEVCGSWAGRKRLVAVCSDERNGFVVRVVLRQLRNGKRARGTNGDAVMLLVMVARRVDRVVWCGHGEYQLESRSAQKGSRGAGQGERGSVGT
jgi:UDP-glucuronate 4-epimerase